MNLNSIQAALDSPVAAMVAAGVNLVAIGAFVREVFKR